MQLSIPRAGAVAPIALVFIAAACSSSATADPDGLSAPDGVASLDRRVVDAAASSAAPLEIPEDREEALLAFAGCMRENGIPMDDPQPGTRGGVFRGGGDGQRDFDRQSGEFQAAQQTCGAYLQAARPQLDAEEQAELVEQSLVMSQCIRDLGYKDYPDPVTDIDGSLQRLGGRALSEVGIDPRSEEFIEARTACADEVGFAGGLGVRGVSR